MYCPVVNGCSNSELGLSIFPMNTYYQLGRQGGTNRVSQPHDSKVRQPQSCDFANVPAIFCCRK